MPLEPGQINGLWWLKDKITPEIKKFLDSFAGSYLTTHFVFYFKSHTWKEPKGLFVSKAI